MVTKVGLQTEFVNALQDLLELEFDAVEAYDAAINRLEDEHYKSKLREFRGEHRVHIRELSAILQKHGKSVPTGPSGKQWLTKGKVVLGSLMGDNSILSAMRSNEVDTVTAYERLNEYNDKWPDSVEILKRGLNDERKHKAWLESVISDATVL